MGSIDSKNNEFQSQILNSLSSVFVKLQNLEQGIESVSKKQSKMDGRVRNEVAKQF